MKNIFLIFSILLAFTSNAQITTVSLYDDEGTSEDNVYYKDIDNDFNRFEGIWVYTNGNKTFTITLQKKVMKHIYRPISETNYYTDALVGEYRYVENGVELINTLPNLLNDYDHPYEYNITGTFISRSGDRLCHNCGPNERKVFCSWSDPNWDIIGSSPKMILRHYVENGVEKIHCTFVDDGGIVTLDPEQQNFLGYSIPFGEYTFIKQ